MPASVDFADLRSRFNVYSALPEEGGKLITSGSFNEEGSFTGILNLPLTLDSITITTIAGTMVTAVPQGTFKDGGIIIDFGEDYGYTAPDTIPPEGTSKSQLYNIMSDNRQPSLSSRTNVISNGDFEINDFGTIYYYNSPHPEKYRWYFTTYGYGRMERFNDGGNYVVRTPYANSYYYGGTSQMIDANAGDVISLSSDIKKAGGGGSLYSDLYLGARNANGQLLNWYYISYNNIASTWKNKQLVATMPSGTSQVQVLLWTNDYKRNSSIYFDNVVVTGPVTDTDGDGVDDDLDDYPTDPDRAFNVYYPNETDFGTLAYEDLWPGKGDYDFNDLVLDYQFKSVLNASNGLVEFFVDYSVRAIGASLTNGFALMIPGDPSNVASVTGTNISENYLNLNANGTEQGQTNTVIFLFDNAFNMIGSSGSSFVNTKEDVAYVSPDTNQAHILYSTPMVNAGSAPYNPFIVVGEERGKEVHLAGEEPTDLVNQSLFGTFADDSNPATGKYYQTSNNLPWALDLPVKFDYPVEQVQIINGYNHFREWGESGGSSFTDWYENKSGYRNNANIYSPPL